MAKPEPASSFLGGTTLTQKPAPPPEETFPPDVAFAEAQAERDLEGEAKVDTDEPVFELPATRRRRKPPRRKIDMYVPSKQADLVDDMCEYVRHHFGVNKGEAQEVILAYGTNNKVEIMRHFRHEAEDE